MRLVVASYWKVVSVSIIYSVLEKMPDESTKRAIVRAVGAAYPFGLRRMHPYKMWCEVRDRMLHEKYPAMFPPPGKKQQRKQNQQEIFE